MMQIYAQNASKYALAAGLRPDPMHEKFMCSPRLRSRDGSLLLRRGERRRGSGGKGLLMSGEKEGEMAYFYLVGGVA